MDGMDVVSHNDSNEMDRTNEARGASVRTQFVERHVQEGSVSALYILADERSCISLRQAAHRIRGNIRRSDSVFLLEQSCVIMLPDTPLAGAQAVERRISSFLIHVEYELRVLFGEPALMLLEQVRNTHTAITQREKFLLEEPQLQKKNTLEAALDVDEKPFPYLAFLENYPSHHILQLFPYELAKRYRCFPVGSERGVLTLATSQRLQQEIVAHLSEVVQRNIFQVRCETHMIDEVLAYWQQIMPT